MLDPNYPWFTPESEKFMRDGQSYLADGQEIDDLVSEKCETAERILKMSGFAKRFREYFRRGFYSFSTPIWTNFGNDRGLPISCVTGETWINTRVGGGKQARDVQVGDEVLTHKGRYRKVVAVMPTRGRGDIYRLKVTGRMTDLFLTGDHRVLTNLGWVRADELDPLVHLVATNRTLDLPGAPRVVDMRPFCGHNFVEREGRLFKAGSANVRPDRRVEVVSYAAAPKAEVPLTSDLAWAIGLWFAEGSVTRNKDVPSGIRVTLDAKDEGAVADRWLGVMSEAFGVDGAKSETSVIRNGKSNRWINVNINCKAVGIFFASFGNGCKEKTVPQWLVESPKDILEAFLDGLIEGDGTPIGGGGHRLTLSNPKLLLQAYQIGLAAGRPMSLQMQQKPGPLATTKWVYTVIFRETVPGRCRSRGDACVPFTDGLGYAPIRTIEKTDRVDDVFDFTVEEDHSFSAAGVVLHNCFNSYFSDSIDSLLGSTHAELAVMTKNGGGTSGYMGHVRGRGSDIQGGRNGQSSGSVHFAAHHQSLIDTCSQGNTRRGNYAPWWDITHPDIMEVLRIKQEGSPIQRLNYGVCVTDAWLQDMIDGDKAKREVWATLLRARKNSGVPYLLFTDTVNNARPIWYKEQDLWVRSSNLCNETTPTSNEEESFVCDLSSMNARRYREWKDTDAPELMVYMLDAVMTEFIEKASHIKHMERAVRYARRHRSLGIGVFGWHHLLQSEMIPFESPEAMRLNAEVFRTIQQKTIAASRQMAKDYGEPEVTKGYGQRHALLQAVAPTTSSAFIIGQASEGIEPNTANIEVKDNARGKYTVTNPYMLEMLARHGKTSDKVLDSILAKAGSVQHLDFLSDHEKMVFRTFPEVSQLTVVQQAAQRQAFIDQGQSLNIFVTDDVPTKQVNALILEGWKMGVKGFYYNKGRNAAQVFTRDMMSCVACEG